jgi:hypothetical protein
MLFNRIDHIDPLARVASNAVLAYIGYDDASIVRDTSPSDLTPPKVRVGLAATAEGKVLLATLEENDGQLTRLCAFLRKLQSGDCDRFLIDHDSNNIESLELLASGSAATHSYLSDWTAPAAITAAAASKLNLSDAASFRRLITHIKSNYPELSYLLLPLPQDNYTKVGNIKDDYLAKFMTIILTSSNLSKTFKLGQGDRLTGHAIFAKTKLHFLSNSDTLTEIQNLQSQFSQIKMTSGVKNVIEEAQGYVNALEDLGELTSNINLYVKIKSILEEGGNYLSNMCVSFRAVNLVPNDGTLDLFLVFITNDPKAMTINTGSNNKQDVNLMDAKPTMDKKAKKKERKANNAKNHAIAMNALSAGKPTLKNGGDYSLVGLPKHMVNYIQKLRVKWNDESYALHSNINKIYNDNLDKDGKGGVNYEGFIAQLIKDHDANKGKHSPPSPPPPPRRNPNVTQANNLEADDFAAQLFRLETDDDSSL